MGLPGGDGRCRGTKDQVIHAVLTSKTDTILDRRAPVTADLFRVVQAEATPCLREIAWERVLEATGNHYFQEVNNQQEKELQPLEGEAISLFYFPHAVYF